MFIKKKEYDQLKDVERVARERYYEISDLEVKNELLHRDIRNQKEELHDLTKELESAYEKNKEKDAENNRQAETIINLQKAVDAKNIEIDKVRSCKNAENKRLENLVDEKLDIIADLAWMNGNQKTIIQNYEKEIEISHNKIDEQDKEIEELKTRLNSIYGEKAAPVKIKSLDLNKGVTFTGTLSRKDTAEVKQILNLNHGFSFKNIPTIESKEMPYETENAEEMPCDEDDVEDDIDKDMPFLTNLILNTIPEKQLIAFNGGKVVYGYKTNDTFQIKVKQILEPWQHVYVLKLVNYSYPMIDMSILNRNGLLVGQVTYDASRDETVFNWRSDKDVKLCSKDDDIGSVAEEEHWDA